MGANQEVMRRAKVFAKHLEAALAELGYVDPEVGILELDEFSGESPLAVRTGIRIDLRHWPRGQHVAAHT